MSLHHHFRFREFLVFSREFIRLVSQVRGVLMTLVLLIAGGGWLLGRWESLPFWEGQYLAFVTALTIGYGDVTPSEPLSRLLCIALGIVGMVWIGLVVGSASVALRRTIEEEQALGEKIESEES